MLTRGSRLGPFEIVSPLGAGGMGEVWRATALDAEPPHAARPVLQGTGDETHAAFSPDGRLFAYTSDETGVPQVYVQTFPPSGAKWQISASGGDQASWRADGREMYYEAGSRIDVVLNWRPTTE